MLRFPFTAKSGLIHGRHARILARFFGVRLDGRGGVGGGEGGGGRGGEEKYSFTVLLERTNIVLQHFFYPNTSEHLLR